MQPRGCIYFAQKSGRCESEYARSQYRTQESAKYTRSRDLARHIMERSLYGKVVVVASNPNSALSAMRKQWVYLLNRLQIDRARTLKTERIFQLSHELVRLRSLTFSAKAKDAMQGCSIVFATADNLMYLAPPCSTLYVTYDFPREQLYLMTSWMPANGLVVFYE